MRARPWIAPLAATLVVGVVLSPGLVQPEDAAPPAKIPVERAETPVQRPAFEVALAESEAVLTPTPPPPEPLVADASDLSSDFDCVIEPAEVVALGSPVTGVIEAIHVDRSDFVTAGQAVAELESDVEHMSVELARARARMQAALRAREANLELGERRKRRVDRLFESETLSLDLKDQAQTEAEIAKLELVEAQEHRRLAALELDQALAVLRRRVVRSPIAGVVVEREMSPGEVVVDERTILTVAQIDPLRVEVILPSALYGTVRKGMRAAVEPEFGDKVHVASVALVDRVIDAASGTFGARLELPNPDHSIPGGLHCQVRFLTE